MTNRLDHWTKTIFIRGDLKGRTLPITILTMAHFDSYDPVPPATVSMLKEAYRRVTSKLANMKDFVRQHMMVGHLPEDPWREASDLQ